MVRYPISFKTYRFLLMHTNFMVEGDPIPNLGEIFINFDKCCVEQGKEEYSFSDLTHDEFKNCTNQ